MTIETTQYLKLKSSDAQKLGRNGGSIRYLILTDTDRQLLYVSIIANDSGGYFSNEIASFDGIEACMPADHTQPFPAKALIRAFVSRSANQPSFCAALLRAEGLTAAVPDKPHLHQVVGDWDDWKLAMLDLPGEPYVPPVKGAQSVEDADETTDGVSWFNQNRHLDQVISDPQGKIESMNDKKLSWFNQNRHLDQVISDPQGKIESMNDKKPRRHFDPAVKLQMIEMVRNQGLSVAQVCSEMKLSRSVLSRWLNQFDQEQAGRPGKGIPLTAEQRRIRELEMQVRQLQSDNALLKKASAFFARELQ